MTLSTTTSRAVYAGNGVTTIFSFPYRFLVNGDLEVTLFDADGVPDPQVLTTDYTVLGADLDAGGSVTMIVAPAVGQTLVIRRVVDLTQETDYNSGDAFPAETHERALDKLTMQDQQLQEQVSRSITVPLDNTTFSGQLPEVVPSTFVRVNDSGTALEFVDVLAAGELVVSPYIETLLDDANAAAARVTLGAQVAGSYATSGANSNITSLSGLTTPLSLAQGGTAGNYANVAALFAAIKQDASTTATGVVELATTAEAQAGTDTVRAVTPSAMQNGKIVQATPVATTSGTTISFTGIPSWAKRVTVLLFGVSTAGSVVPELRMGSSSGGYENSGYVGSIVTLPNGSSPVGVLAASGVPFAGAGAAASVYQGAITLINSSGNNWIATVSLGRSDTANPSSGAVSKSLSSTLDRVQIVTADGFDAGSMNVVWE